MKNQKNTLKLLGLLTCLLIFFSSCKKKNGDTPLIDSFLPMQVGNYWGTANRQNSYTEIQETTQIGGKTYYKFFSLVGGDGMSTSYLRIDDHNRLLQAFPDQPSLIYTRADFNAKVGDVFFTLNDKSVNDYKVTVKSKTNTEMEFEFEMVYHPNLKGQTHIDKYVKGIGWSANFEKIIIDGKVIKGT